MYLKTCLQELLASAYLCNSTILGAFVLKLSITRAYFLLALLLCTMPSLRCKTPKNTPQYTFEQLLSMDYSSLKEALDNDSDLVYKREGDNEETLLMYALRQDCNIDIIKLLLKEGSNVKTKAKDGKTALMIASQYTSDTKAVRSVLKRKTLFNIGVKKRLLATDKEDNNSFYYARLGANNKVYTLLTKYAKDPNPTKPLPRPKVEPPPPPPVVIQEEVIPGIDLKDVDLDTEDYEEVSKKEVKHTYLFDTDTLEAEAPYNKNTAIITQSKEANINLLFSSAKLGDSATIQALINAGISPDETDAEGWSALMYCARYAPTDSACKTLILAGADVFLKNKAGRQAIEFAIIYNANPALTACLLSSYKLSHQGLMDLFFLAITAQDSAEEKVRAFIDKGISIDAPRNGKTALIFAAQNARSNGVLQVLLDARANPHIRDTKGMSAFDYAKKNRYLQHDATYWALNQNQ